jgi:predicted transcriptional regulator
MNKPVRPEMDDREPLDDGLGPTPTEAERDAWYAQNREAIVALVEEGFAEIERGEFDERSFAEIIAEGVERNGAKR